MWGWGCAVRALLPWEGGDGGVSVVDGGVGVRDGKVCM